MFCAGHVEAMESIVADAVAKGASIKCGGKRWVGDGQGGRGAGGQDTTNGFFFEPTVLVDAEWGMKVMSEETFGPVVALSRVTQGEASAENVAHLLGSGEHGLTAGVYSKDRGVAEDILGRVSCGTVYWNKHGIVEPWMPWAGRRASGSGVFLGFQGIRECFLKPKAWFF
jgi:betaine-aldehyde dehydrogenase